MTEHSPQEEPRNSRRSFCRGVTAAMVAASIQPATAGAAEEQGKANRKAYPGNADEALKRLTEGNRRFWMERTRHPHESKDWRVSLESGQHPYAVVLGCADSRVCPELLFDQGLGDLFVVRVAGNIVDVDVTASVEYAVSHLNTKLIVVLGHSDCGAVTATLDHLAESADEPDEIVSLLYRIEPALAGIPDKLPRKDRVALGVKKNVEFSVRRLMRVPDLKESMQTDGLRIVGAVYDMHTGRVDFSTS